ncbi:MAG: hypothetical protein WAX14_09815 [Rhodococcus sp. (in: high G+C Gram-positive bacteria)]|uniref:hypothetical protein n=1 Tax=Rhodococcus sp. TaxID=1831 RepID=UPI003BB569EC
MTQPVGPGTFRKLADAAESGTLYLEPGAADTCVAACDRFIEALQHLQGTCENLEVSEAFGHLPSARALGLKFDAKATGPGGLFEVLQTHIDTVAAMRAMFAAAGKAYLDTDAETRESLRRATT